VTVAPPSEWMRTIKAKNFRRKNAHRCGYKLNKLSNLSELFIAKKLMEKTLKKDDKFGGKPDQTKLKNDGNLEENAQKCVQ